MRKRRVISKSKTYGFNPYTDQIDTINQIMRETGEKTESVLLRKLVDEALAARREKNESLPLIAESDDEFGHRLEAIEGLLIQLVRQGDTSYRIQDVLLALLQDVLAETHAGRRLSWDSLVVPELHRKGVDANELESRFMAQGAQAKNYAYGLAQQIKQSQESTEWNCYRLAFRDNCARELAWEKLFGSVFGERSTDWTKFMPSLLIDLSDRFFKEVAPPSEISNGMMTKASGT